MYNSGADCPIGGRYCGSDNRRLTRRLFAVGAAFVVLACGGGDTAPAPVTLSGSVVLQDAWANALDDFSGVAVTVDGVSTQAVTDKSGAWHIDGVPTGRHDITFKKATFGDMRIPVLDVSGPTMTTSVVTMTTPPWEQAVIDSIRVGKSGGRDYYFVEGHLSAPPPANARAGATVAFLSKTASVSNDISAFDAWNLSVDLTGKSPTFSISLSVDAARATFGSGTRIYAAAYVASVVCGCYNDPATKKPIFASVGPRGNVVSITVQ